MPFTCEHTYIIKMRQSFYEAWSQAVLNLLQEGKKVSWISCHGQISTAQVQDMPVRRTETLPPAGPKAILAAGSPASNSHRDLLNQRSYWATKTK